MIKQFFSTEGKYAQVMSRLFDLIVLNVLLMICSLPVITLGASLTAVYDMSLRMLREEEGLITKGFFRAFRRNFRPALKLWLICLMVLAVCVGDLWAGRTLADMGLELPLTAVAGIQAVLLVMVMQYAFALTARFENTLGGTLKNSILLAMTHLPDTLIMTLISMSAFLILAFVPLPEKIFSCFVTMLLMFWFAGCVYLNSRRIHRIFQQHFGSEEPEEEQLSAARQETDAGRNPGEMISIR